MKIEKENQKRKEIKDVINYIKSKEYGTTIEFMELQPFTTLFNLTDEYEQYQFKSCFMAIVKKELIQYGIVLKSIRNVGYYILKPNQISSYTYRTYIRKPLKAFERASYILENTDKNKLNTIEIEEYNLTTELNDRLINTNYEIIVEGKYSNLGETK